MQKIAQPLELEMLEKAITASWCRETCFPLWRDSWSNDNLSYGQSDATSLIVQHFFGGEICYCIHLGHYWNRLNNQDGKDNEREVDFTRKQYAPHIQKMICFDKYTNFGEMVFESSIKDARLIERSSALKQKVEDYIKKIEISL